MHRSNGVAQEHQSICYFLFIASFLFLRTYNNVAMNCSLIALSISCFLNLQNCQPKFLVEADMASRFKLDRLIMKLKWAELLLCEWVDLIRLTSVTSNKFSIKTLHIKMTLPDSRLVVSEKYQQKMSMSLASVSSGEKFPNGVICLCWWHNGFYRKE